MSLGNVGAPAAPVSWLQEGWASLREYAQNALIQFKRDEDMRDETRAGKIEEAPGAARWGIVAVDLIDNEASLEARFEVPGMNKEDLEVEIIADRLIVRGCKKMDQQRRHAGCLITERAYGRFQRSIPVPQGLQLEGVTAAYNDGVLNVHLPKMRRGRVTLK